MLGRFAGPNISSWHQKRFDLTSSNAGCCLESGNTPIISNYFATESARNPKGVAKAVDALLESGLTMDPKLIKAAVAAHDKALDSALKDPNLVTTKADFAAVNEALARMIASANKD